MKKFKRGLNDIALEKARQFFATDVGRRIVDDKNMHICIRDNYINVYLNGCSLLKYSPLASKNKFLIHYKYLDIPKPNKKNPYVAMKFNGKDLCYGNEKSFIKDVMLLPSAKLKAYTISAEGTEDAGEKALLAQYLYKANPKPFILDLEVSFTRKRTDEEKENKKRDTVADRIDMAVLESENGRMVLRLIEVKVDYDSRLKAEDDGNQEILKQMKKYKEEFLDKQYKNIQDSYFTIAKNYLELGLDNRLGKDNSKQILEAFISNGSLDESPFLLVIITNTENMKGRNGICHFERLQNQFKANYPPPRTWPFTKDNG